MWCNGTGWPRTTTSFDRRRRVESGPVKCQQRGLAAGVIFDQGADQAEQFQMFRAMHPADQKFANLKECRPSPGWAIWLVPD